MSSIVWWTGGHDAQWYFEHISLAVILNSFLLSWSCSMNTTLQNPHRHSYICQMLNVYISHTQNMLWLTIGRRVYVDVMTITHCLSWTIIKGLMEDVIIINLLFNFICHVVTVVMLLQYCKLIRKIPWTHFTTVCIYRLSDKTWTHKMITTATGSFGYTYVYANSTALRLWLGQ